MYLNEIDPFCCAVLRKNFPEAQVDERDIRDVQPGDLAHDQCHFFAGIGGFPLGLSWAGWPYNPNLDAVVKTAYPSSSGPMYTTEERKMAGKLKKLTEEQAAECVKMYGAGMSLQKVADYFKVSRQAMWDLLRRRTTLRSQQRQGQENHFARGGNRADGHAHNMVEYAVRKGIIERRSVCENCGATGKFKDGRSSIQAHHDDYNKPLEVRWLCQRCHHEWHRHNTAKRKEVREPAATGPIWTGGFP